jgi:catalase
MDRERPTAAPPSMAGTDWSETYMGGSPDAERALIAAVMPRVERIQDAVAAKQRADVRRAFHNKGAVVRIGFDVAPDLPDALRVAFLRPGASYRGFGRFSRSQSFRLRDKDRDQRGFAFRIETDVGAQDILLSNTPASFARDPVQFMKVAALFAEHPQPVAAILIFPTVGLREGLRILGDLLKPPDRAIAFTSQRYWSRTAFQIGDAAARLFVRPTSGVRKVAIEDDPDYLTTDLISDLRQESRSFELCAQLFVDEEQTPIEDASRAWDEGVAPPIVLGTVTIAQQELDSPEAEELAERVENLEAFSPVVTPGLRPLGRMNRARVIAYARSADHRRPRPAR